MSAIEQRYYTVKEYFELVERLDYKVEYHDGHIVALAGGTSDHSIIATNIRRRLAEKLDDTDCVVYDSDMQLAIESANRYVYPDAMIVCGDREFTDEKQTRIKNPLLIVEVLSNSTGSFDKTEKFRYYRSLLSFREYLMINPEKPAVDAFYREEENLWRISSATGLDSHIHLYSIRADILLKDIYAKTKELQQD